MTTTVILLIILALFTKHFIVDFPLQKPYHYLNKGTYGHPGGVNHALLHGIGTFLVMVWFVPDLAVYFMLADTAIHYHIDWAKMKLNSVMGWKPDTHEEFWWLLGFDQFLHALTYICFAALLL